MIESGRRFVTVLIASSLTAGAGCSEGWGLQPGGGKPTSEDNEPLVRVMGAVTIPSDPLFPAQWGLLNTGQVVEQEVDDEILTFVGIPGIDINATRAWDITQGSSAVIVAIIEQSDLDLTHEDLRDQVLAGGCGAEGCDFIDRDGMNGPFVGHGNHVAGIIAARKDNNRGGVGAAPKIKILPLRAKANDNTIIAAIAHARSKGARIVNLSQGSEGGEEAAFDGNYYNPAVLAAMRAASDVLFVCSAGNNGTARYNFPSSYDAPNILAVANVDPRGELSVRSNYNEVTVDIAAPGLGIRSTLLDNQYGDLSGTSMAAGFVSGTAALLMNKFPTLTVTQVIDRLKRTGMKLASLRGLVGSGAMVDAFAALTDVAPIANFNATSVPGAVTLTWDRVSGATRYDVERDGVVVNNGTSNRFVHSGLTVGSAHFYRVRAVVGSTAQLWSRRWMKLAERDPVAETLSPAVQSPHPYPNGVDELRVPFTRPNAVKIRIHFARLDMQGSFDTGYNNDYVRYCSAFEPGCDEGETNHFFGDYSAGFWTHWAPTPFSFWFHSDDTINDYGYLVDRIEYLQAIPAQPPAPFLLEVLPNHTVSLSQSATAGADSLNIYRSTASGSGYLRIATIPASQGQYLDTTTTAGRTFFYKVSAVNGLGESPLSDFTQVVVP